jgi:site-specific DNA-methyltransferase (adenine-specific)/adenine-specific DNA-methyltransferase
VIIRKFNAEAMTRNSESPTGFDALAMVMVDLNYDGSVFDLDLVCYGEELEKSKYSFGLPKGNAGEQLMMIYVDVYGNEYREVKKVSDFKVSKGR